MCCKDRFDTLLLFFAPRFTQLAIEKNRCSVHCNVEGIFSDQIEICNFFNYSIYEQINGTSVTIGVQWWCLRYLAV